MADTKDAEHIVTEEERLVQIFRNIEQERFNVFRSMIEKCELWIVLVTLIPWVITWAIVINFYPTEAMITLLAELVDRSQ